MEKLAGNCGKRNGSSKTAIISGVCGQDGSYLAELLLRKGYTVVGLKRRTSLINTDRVDHLFPANPNFILEYHDLSDASSTWRLISKYQPDEFYNLAAQSHVKVSFDVPEDTIHGITVGTLHILEAIRSLVPTVVSIKHRHQRCMVMHHAPKLGIPNRQG